MPDLQPPTDILHVEAIGQVVKVFSSVQCDFIGENCIVALEMSNHVPGCKMIITGDKPDSVQLHWEKKVTKSGYKEEKKIIEHGAEGIAFLLAPKMTGYTVIEEAVIGTGVDYWLGYDESDVNYNPKNFLQARLEVSGIKAETPTNSLSKRVRGKKLQTGKSDGLKLPAYVSVTEFASPKTYFGKK